MMRATLMICAFALAAPAFAARPVSAEPSDDLSIQAMHNFAACVADQSPRGAAEVLALDYRSPEYSKKVSRLSKETADHCAPSTRGRFSQMLFAGGLAERLMASRLSDDRFARAVAYDAARPPIDGRSVGEVAAICVVRAEPTKSQSLFRTDPTSREELAALQAIGPTLAGCIPSGQKMAVNRQGVRAILALAAYRLTRADAPVTAFARPVLQNTVKQ